MSQRIRPDELLDALRESVLAVGVRRTTFADVSRRSGISRMTLYRHLGDVQSGVAQLMTREFSQLLLDVQQETAELPTAREQLVEGAVRAARRLQDSDLFRRVLDLDPELLLPYVIDRLGGTQRAAVAMFRTAVAQGQADGSIRVVDADLAAFCMELVMQSFVLSVRVAADMHKPDDVADEIRHLLHAYLRPVGSAP
jgi:AcrR family transcriptional regulator